MIRQAKKIEVGTHDGKVGFTVTYADDHKEHFLFKPAIATKLGNLLTKVAETYEQLSTPLDDPQIALADEEIVNEEEGKRGYRENVGVGESVSVGLTQPKKLH